MELPPRVRTQYPNRGNATGDERIPVPIETAYFLEDAEQDDAKMNRYYFNFPAEWATSNKGETIVGIRSMWLVQRRRRLEFTIELIKVNKLMYKSFGGDLNADKFDANKWSSDKLTELTKNTKLAKFKVVDWLSTDGDLRGVFDAINMAFKKFIATNKYGSYFTQDDDDIINRDIQTDGYYDKDGFHEILFSYKNDNMEKNLIGYKIEYLNFFRIYDYNDDFKEVFNIGTKPFQNKPDETNVYYKKLVFDNIWDRHSCKVYSSIGEQSLHHYIGNSQVYFNPIKYYKLNSADQKFWIELYSGRNYNVPIKLPKNESFVMEMQFLQYDKMLYV